MAASTWCDTPLAYGRITRLLHWGMAALFAWQFAGMGFRAMGILQPLSDAIRSTHGAVGTLLLTLVLLRAAWGLSQSRRRPAPPAPPGRLVTLGHVLIYALMVAVPAIALLRLWGSGRAFAPFGIPLFDGAQGQTPGLVSLGNALHGELAWVLLAVIGGHILMALGHRILWQHDILPRMTGTAGSGAADH